MKGSIGRTIFALGALAVGGVAAALLIGEVAARLLWSAPVTVLPAAPRPGGLVELNSIFQLATPGIEGIHKGVYYRTNSAGFRGPEYDLRPAPGVFRIVVVGDSFVMGEGVLEEEAYPAVLEDLLNDLAGGQRYEVLNLGLSGLNINHVVERLKTLGLSFHPDLIVYGLTSNDIEVKGYRTTISGETIQAQRDRYAAFADSRSYLLRLLWPRWVSLRTGLNPPVGTYMYEVFDNYLHNPKVWANFVSGFDRLADIQRETGIPIVVFIHPILAYLRAFHPFDEVYGVVEAAAEARGLRVIQGYPSVVGRRAEALWISPANPHPNVQAHRLFAQRLRDGLLAMPDVVPAAQ